MKPAALRRYVNIFPPFLFSGIRVLSIRSDDWRHARVRLKLNGTTATIVGTAHSAAACWR